MIVLAQEEGFEVRLDVSVNGNAKANIVPFMIMPDGSIVISGSELKEIGLKLPQGTSDTQSIDLSTLPGVKVAYNDATQKIDLTVPNELLLAAVVDGRGEVTFEKPQRSDFGVLLNYLGFVSSDVTSGLRQVDNVALSLDTRIVSPFGSLEQSGIVQQANGRETEIYRLDTQFSYTDVDLATTFRLGDTISVAAPWARPIRLFGLQGVSNYAVRPDIVTAALPSFDGSAEVPTTLDVYVNNVKTYSRDVLAGPYSLRNIPGVSGQGDVEIVTRDVTGREVRTRLPFFATSSLLNPGVYEFGAQLGYARYFYAVSNFTYGDKPLGTASLRAGVTDWLTLEGYGEGGAGLENLGGGATLKLFNFGTLTLAAQASRFKSEFGYQPYIAFDTTIGDYRLAFSSQRTIGPYEDLASVTAEPVAGSGSFGLFSWDRDQSPAAWTEEDARRARPSRAIDRVSISTSGPFEQSRISLSYASVERASGDNSQLVSALYSQSLTRSMSLFVNGTLDLASNSSAFLSVGLSGSLDDVSVSSGSTFSQRGGVSSSLSAGRGLSSEPGSVGWRIGAAASGTELVAGSAAAAYMTDFARFGLSGTATSNERRGEGEIEGSIGMIGTSLAFGSRVDGAFAIADVGQPGIDVLQNGRRVGTSNFLGNVLVPLVPYQPNSVSVDLTKISDELIFSSTDERVVPGYGSGIRLTFKPAVNGRSAIIALVDGDGVELPAGLLGKLERTGDDVVVGRGGEVFASDLTDNDVIIIEREDGTCRAPVQLSPETKDIIIDAIGPFACTL